MALNYVTITGSFAGGDGTPATGTVRFVPSQAVYAGAQPLVQSEAPVQCQIVGGQLQALGGGPVKLLATDNAGLRYLTLTGWFYWTAEVTVNGESEAAFSFFLPSSPASTDLYALANSTAGGGGVQLAGDLGGTDASPEVTGTHLTDPLPVAQGGTGEATTSAALTALGAASAAALTAETARAEAAEAAAVPLSGAAMGGPLSPKVVTLTDAAAIAVDASLGNDFRVTLGGNRTMSAPANPVDGQGITFEVIQDATGSRAVTWASGAGGYSFGSGAAPALTAAAGKRDLVAFRYSASANAWLYLGSNGGF